MQLRIFDADPDRFGANEDVEIEGLGVVTGYPYTDLADLFETSWEDTDEEERTAGISGCGKYERDELHAYARGYTAHVAGSTAEVTLEWSGEGGPLREVSTYRDGERVDGTHTEDVPDRLPELIAAVREAAAASEQAAEGDSNDAESDAATRLREAATALADALDPPQAPKK